jgi:hypothetical protein
MLFLLMICCSLGTFAQYEDAGPIHYGQLKKHVPKSTGITFDSTFIYLSDTLTIPVFDDFSTNKFQVYNADYSDPGVTSVKQYRLLDLSSFPLPNDVLYTQQQTFRRVFDVSNGTFSDSYLIPTEIQLGDLTSYPASYQTIDAYPPYYIYDTIDFPNEPDTIWIPDAELYQDSATQFFAPISNPELYWLDQHAYHNYSMALDPWSIGVVTFDGTDEDGFPYAIGTSTSGPADFLTSKPIDLSAYLPGDSVYLSFLFQPQGLCDPPEASGSGSDSLFLQFYNKLTDEWNTVWSGGGSNVADFDYGHIRLDAPGYYNDYFQFRFYNYGSLAGALDHYHLDYVNLRALSGYQDTLFKDYALVYPVYSLLRDYTSVPWDHYQNNFSGKMTDQVQVVVRNGSNLPENNSVDGSVEVSYGGNPEGSFVLSGPALSNGSLNYAPRTTYYSYHDFSGGYHFDETKPGFEQVFDYKTKVSAQFPNFTGNDSIFGTQVFRNYYSYDDGSAELSYGPTGAQSMLAIKYEPYESDSVVGALIHFAPTPIDVSNNLFLLTLWDDNGGAPGAILYQDNSFFPRQPVYYPERNSFAQYIFTDTVKIPVDGTFYIGWRQIDPERLGVGLDMNIPNADKTFISINQGVTWQQSAFAGSVMIRPLFSTSMDFTLGIEEVKEEFKTELYPNPAGEFINLRFSDSASHEVELIDLMGTVLLRSTEEKIDISQLKNGVYLVRVLDSKEVIKFIKL